MNSCPQIFSRYLKIANQACDDFTKDSGIAISVTYKAIDEKYQAGLVSEADRESEKSIVALLENLSQSTAFSEKNSGGADTPKNATSVWMIDPLDGTTNYIHQFPFFCISIGLEIDGELVLGVIDAPEAR